MYHFIVSITGVLRKIDFDFDTGFCFSEDLQSIVCEKEKVGIEENMSLYCLDSLTTFRENILQVENLVDILEGL